MGGIPCFQRTFGAGGEAVSGACWRPEVTHAGVSSRPEPLWQLRCWFDAENHVLPVDYVTGAADLILIIPVEQVGRWAEIREFTAANRPGEAFDGDRGSIAVSPSPRCAYYGPSVFNSLRGAGRIWSGKMQKMLFGR